MEIQLILADDMQAVKPAKRLRTRVRMRYTPLSRSEWMRAHRLLLAQALAIAFYVLIIGKWKPSSFAQAAIFMELLP